MSTVLDVQIPRAYGDLFRPARYKVYWGGRGAAKDWSFARALILKAYQRALRVLCLRELQRSIRDSVHRLLSDLIRALGLEWFFDITDTEIRGRNGALFLFRGLRHNVTEIKSIEGVDIAWVNEAQSVSADSWDILDPTIRRDGSEIWVSFNPDLPDDETWKRFVVAPPPGAVVRHVTFRDNPFFPEVLRPQMEWDRQNRPDLYRWKWLGEPRKITKALILHGHYRLEPVEPSMPGADPVVGMDFGFAQDPVAVVRAYIHDGALYVAASAGGVGVEIQDIGELLDHVLPRDSEGRPMKRWPVRADSARPETIRFLQREGYNVLPVKKGAGSVMDGIEYLKSFTDIIIDPTEAAGVADEAGLYSYKVDRVTGDVLPIVVDAHNHYLDALRYALEEHMRRQRVPQVTVRRRIV